MRILLSIHRATTLFVVVFTLYLSFTGVLVLLVDLRSALTHTPKNDPNVVPIWDDENGPPNFKVMSVADVTATPLPEASNFGAMLARVMQSARAAAPTEAVRYVELRMLNGRPVGLLGTPGGVLRFDAVNGAQIIGTPRRTGSGEPKPIRSRLKYIHRMTFGVTEQSLFAPGPIFAVLTACGLIVLLVTGILIYLPMWKARARTRRFSLFWKSGGWWRSLHRAVSILAALFLANVMCSGLLLAVDDIYHSAYLSRAAHNSAIPSGQVPGYNTDASTPLRDAEVPAMLGTTLSAGQSAAPAEPIKIIRIRYFAGMPQGVLVVGAGDRTRQIVFNTATGKRVGPTETGYPATIFPFGWQVHQTAKSIHRGDFFGLTGSMMVLLAGISIFYLSLSGAVLYYRKWEQRRRAGKSDLLWV
jgi:uncharacterized iron-regulated membrane protein